jgi:hypothetical protein
MPTRSKPRNAANPIDFGDLAALIGVPENDPSVAALLEKAGEARWEKPHGRSRYTAFARPRLDQVRVARSGRGRRAESSRTGTITVE